MSKVEKQGTPGRKKAEKGWENLKRKAKEKLGF